MKFVLLGILSLISFAFAYQKGPSYCIPEHCRKSYPVIIRDKWERRYEGDRSKDQGYADCTVYGFCGRY